MVVEEIRLNNLNPIINLNNLEEKNYYIAEAMSRKQLILYTSANVILYLYLPFVKWKELTPKKSGGQLFFIILSVTHLLFSLSRLFCYYNTYRNLTLYGANSILALTLLTAYVSDIPLHNTLGIYIPSILGAIVMSVLLTVNDRKLYSINIKELIEELQREDPTKNMEILLS